MKRIRMLSLILLLLCLLASLDIGLTFAYSLIPETNDGIIGPSLVMRLLAGEDGWTRVDYYRWFAASAWITLGVALENTVLMLFKEK